MGSTLNNLVRVGQVSSITPGKMTARVVFPDKDNVVSSELAILVPNTQRNKYYSMPSVGEQVVCLFLANGLEEGFIVGACYTDVDKPKIADENMKRIDFTGGGYVEYNAAKNECTIVGDVTIKGKVTITKDANIGGISFINHVHGGVEPGGGNTDKPK